MLIQKINTANLIKSNNKQKFSNPIEKNKIYTDYKNVGIKDIPFYYPISFGAVEKTDTKIDFQESLKKYYRLSPDKYQIQSAKYIYDNSDTLVLAPTGTGKTLIAEYAINKNLDNNKRTFYTTPLKALSNEKYTDFCKLYGKENVGLLTGDIKINPEAPIVIMTTEIYRNILVGEKKQDIENRLKDVATVIFDEFHYMNDNDRGEVWETSIMYTPQNVQQLLLSATAQNGQDINRWMTRLLTEKSSTRTAQIVNVPAEERHVPLKYFIFDPKRSKSSIIPLMKESYSIKKLTKSLMPESKTKLTDKQKEILLEIAQKAGKENSLNAGIEALSQITDFTGDLKTLEKSLTEKLGFPAIEAQRAAAILSNKADRRFNDALKGDSKPSSKEAKHDYYSNGKPQRIISKDKLSEILSSGIINHKAERTLMQFDRATGGRGIAEDGLEKLKKIIGDKEIKTKDFEKILSLSGLKYESINNLTKLITVVKNNNFVPAEFDLIKVLDKENKLPAIFFKFSKKQCNNLRDEFLKTGQSLLTDDEKEKAKEIIKKHLEKGVFLGTGEDASALLSGVAVHHAGKMPPYKALVEELAQNKLIKVVFATSTLGAGINVPAKTVAFTQLTRFAGENGGKNGEKFVSLTPSEFQQMAGRAGRRGKDSIGNVVIMPDQSHGAMSIYNLVCEKPDAIKSSFKPTYSFISHYISQEGSDKDLEDAVDKSFLREKLEAAGIAPYKIINKIKKQFTSMAKVLTSKELECFEEQNGQLIPTIKGEIVSKARGINGLLFAETILNAGLQYLTPEELASVACALTEGDIEENPIPYHLEESVVDTLFGIEKLYSKLQKIQDREHVNTEPLILNRKDAQYVYKWANIKDENSREGWEKLIKENIKKHPTFNEGDFLKIVNRTIDIVEQIKEVSHFAAEEGEYLGEKPEFIENMKKIQSTANKTLKLLKRDPVEYEL